MLVVRSRSRSPSRSKSATARPRPTFGVREAAADFRGDVVELCLPLIQEELWRLRVADVAADVAHGVVNVAVGDGKIQAAVEIGVEKNAAESERVERSRAHAGLHGDIVKGFSVGAIEAEHFVVEIGDDDAGLAGVVEVGDIHAHAGARFAFVAEGEAQLRRRHP